MKQITIRGIPEVVNRTIRKEAERRGLSLGQAVLSLLDRAVAGESRVRKKKSLYHDLDYLSGIWTQNESAAFEKHLKAQRKTHK